MSDHVPMLKNRNREKLVQAVLYFAINTRSLGKIKLFKLLYLLDFEHYRQTGHSVTGLRYSAWKMGPVPVSLAQEWDEPDTDLEAVITIVNEPVYDHTRQAVKAKVAAAFVDDHFTRRELRLMADIVERFRDTQSARMIDVTHAENGAWAKVWNQGAGLNDTIAYELALSKDDPHREDILGAAQEYEAIASANCA